jgi:nucleotide-binding universal stress UspA family protein
MSEQIRTIVVGVAMVEELDPVLPSAVRLAERIGARLHIVHVLALPDLAIVSGAPGLQGLSIDSAYVTDRTRAIEEELRGQCSRFAAAPETLRIHVLAGSAHRELAAFGARMGADLLVIGAMRHGRVWRNLIGTTAERVLRESTVPVLVLHQPFYRAVQRVLLTTDLSELSGGIHERGLDLVEELFGDDGLTCRSLLALGYGLPAEPALSIEQLAALELERFLAERRPRDLKVEGRVRLGEPASEINVEAEAWSADLIVLGTHGRHGASRYLFGSVAAATLRDATRNALVIPAAATIPGTPLSANIVSDGASERQAQESRVG